MTDLQKFIELYKSLGVELIVNIDFEKEKQHVILHEGTYADETMTTGFDGYTGFYSQIKFDIDGKFLKQGFWE
jgi:hypothetical protein